MNLQGGAVKQWTSNDKGSTILLKERKDFEITVSGLGYATLFLDYAAYIPTDVEAYAVTSVEDGYAKMTQVEGTLPANTGVILKNAGEYTFTTSVVNVSAVAGNMLAGTVVDTQISKDAANAYYILYNGDKGLGFYNPVLDNEVSVFKNAANKAYLVVPAVQAQGIASYSFRFEGATTAIENVEVENTVKAIFDLTGRQVEAITAPGIYIVNGKKVLVK